MDHGRRARADSVRLVASRLKQVAALAALVLATACGSDPAPASSDPAPLPFPTRRAPFPVGTQTLAYVTNGASDSVSVVDLDAMQTLANVPIGLDPVDPDGPTDLVVDRAQNLVYLALSYPFPADEGPHAAHHALPRPGFVEVLRLDDLTSLGAFPVDVNPTGLALSTDGSTLLVAHDDVDRAAQLGVSIDVRRAPLWVIAPARGLLDETANAQAVTACAAPYSVTYGAGASRAFVTCTGEDSLAVVDPQALAVVDRVPVTVPLGGVSKPYAAVANATGDALAVSSSVARSVTLFETSDAAPRWTSVFDGRTATVPSGVPYFAAWVDGDTLIVPFQSPDGAALLDASSGDVLSTVSYTPEQCESPRQARVTRDGRVFLSCAGDGFAPGAVVQLDPATLGVTARAVVELSPDRFAVLEP